MPLPKWIDSAEVHRRLVAGEHHEAIAAALGVERSTIGYWRQRLGLPKATRRRVDRDRVRELHAQLLSYADIGDAIGCSVTTVRNVVREIGLVPHGKRSVSFKRKMSDHFRRRCVAAGVASLRQLVPDDPHWANTRRLCERYGLPDDIRRVQVRVILALAAGPLPADQLADACGRNQRKAGGYHRFNMPSCPGGNYLTDLCKRGLLAAVKRPNRPTIYLLAAHCLDLLARAKESP